MFINFFPQIPKMELVEQSNQTPRKLETGGLREKWNQTGGSGPWETYLTTSSVRPAHGEARHLMVPRWSGRHEGIGRGGSYWHDSIWQTMLSSSGLTHALLHVTKKTNLPPNSRPGNNSSSMPTSQGRTLYEKPWTKWILWSTECPWYLL